MLKPKFILLVTIVLAACGGAPTGSPEALADDLQRSLDSWRSLHGQPGVSIAVILPEGETYSFASGYQDEHNLEPVPPDGHFRIGSVTKTFVAALTLQLEEEGLLSLDEKMDGWFPDFPNADEITIEHLLGHRSGVFNFTDSGDFINAMAADLTRRWTVEEIVAEIAQEQPLFVPGTSWYYSNTNYLLLGAIIEQVSGNPVEADLRERFLAPLGLTNTYFAGREVLPALVAGFSDGFDVSGDYLSIETAASTAGAMVSSVVDLASWGQALYGDAALSDEALAKMLTPSGFQSAVENLGGIEGMDYGLGVMLIPTTAGPAVGHGGDIPGYTCLLLYALESGVSAAACANTDANIEAVGSRPQDLTPLVEDLLAIVAEARLE